MNEKSNNNSHLGVVRSGQLNGKENELSQALVTYARSIARIVLKHRPQSKIDGIHNIWILKPGDKSSGRGIILKSRLVDILAKVNQAKESTQYVIQKYIGIVHLHF